MSQLKLIWAWERRCWFVFCVNSIFIWSPTDGVSLQRQFKINAARVFLQLPDELLLNLFYHTFMFGFTPSSKKTTEKINIGSSLKEKLCDWISYSFNLFSFSFILKADVKLLTLQHYLLVLKGCIEMSFIDRTVNILPVADIFLVLHNTVTIYSSKLIIALNQKNSCVF